MISYFASHPTAANLLMIAMMLLGLTALPKLQRDTFPLIPATEVNIRIPYPGATPADVESGICQRIEDAMDSVSGIKEVRCDARENIAMVKADVTQPSTLPPLLAGADFVISSIGVSGKGEARAEDVDYGGSLALIDASKSAGIKKFIMVSSGGVTWWTHPINWFSGGVLTWKRKAEIYLRGSGLTHVIVRPNGGLNDESGNSNKIIFTQTDGFPWSISREDVAIVSIKALAHKEADNKTFEIRNSDDGLVTSSVDWTKTFSSLVVQSDNF